VAALESFGAVPAAAQIGGRIRELRKCYNFTQADLAQRIGVQQSDLSRIEKGEYRASLDVLFRILSVFRLSIGEFFEDVLTNGMTLDELELVKKCRSLSNEGRREVAEFVEFRVRREREGPRREPHPHLRPVAVRETAESDR
jgi:transcriptional regulator with XRE-family HTH domain